MGIVRSKEQIAFERKVLDIEIAVTKAVNDACEKSGNTTTYLEIDSALINVLKSNQRHQKNEYFQPTETD